MKNPAVNVFVAGNLAGTLARSNVEQDTFLFTYGARCPDDDAVSLTMPVVPDQYDSVGTIHPVFEMNLPEGQLRHKLELMFSKAIRGFDALSLLAVTGKSQIGRLRYAEEGMMPGEVPTQNIQKLLAYQGAEDLFDDLMDRFAMYSGISGMQPKVLVRDAAILSGRVTDRGATHIVKSFSPAEFHELAANEFFSMQASRHTGLPTANARLSDNRKMLVIERFDRTESGAYLGFEDFCVLSGLRSGGRYNASYEELAKRISLYVSPEYFVASMEQFFGMVTLSCAIGNGDAHLKNFGVLYDKPGAGVRLAPVYDMLSTVAYFPREALALELSGSKKFPSRKQIIQFGRQACGLSGHQVESILARVANGVGLAIQEMQLYAQAHPDFQPTADHLIRVFTKDA